jgi:hypothetical protein
MINMTALGLGGLAAAITAGWQQVKNALNYVSSFVVINASFDHRLSPVVMAYLKREYRPLPSGLLNYMSLRLAVKGRKDAVLIPFRVVSNTSIYVGKRSIMVVSVSDSTLKIRAVRGSINFDRFTSDALDSWDENLKLNTKKRDSRFWVSKVIGSEKGSFSSYRNANHGTKVQADNDGPGGEAGDAMPSSSSSLLAPNVSLDRSFKYEREFYAIQEEDDPLEGLFFEPKILKYFEQAMQWLQLGEWYTERQIPWRLGWLLHGPGGTGKSSIAKATAQNLGVPIYHYYLATLSDQEFIERWERMATPCIALFEDFDAVFHGRENQTEHKSLTFDCVLNQISGVSALSGVFLIVTTNHIEHIDHALGTQVEKGSEKSTRPGRIDSVIEVSFISAENRRKMAYKILRDWPDLIDELMAQHSGGNWTPSQWQEVCIQAALERLHSTDHLGVIPHDSTVSEAPQLKVA